MNGTQLWTAAVTKMAHSAPVESQECNSQASLPDESTFHGTVPKCPKYPLPNAKVTLPSLAHSATSVLTAVFFYVFLLSYPYTSGSFCAAFKFNDKSFTYVCFSIPKKERNSCHKKKYMEMS